MTTICTIYLKIFFKTIVTGVMIARKIFSALTTYNLPLLLRHLHNQKL